MVDRPNKPSALAAAPQQQLPQATVSVDDGLVKASLPTGETVEVLLHGATVTSWKDANGQEKLWLSEKAVLDGSKAVRGGIPVVFPVFGTAPDHAATSKLPQHGFARTSRWEFLGKSTSESANNSASADLSVKLDFGLSSASLDDKTKALWPYEFHLIYSVTLERSSLGTAVVITNKDEKAWDFEVLLHTYLRVKDITQVAVEGLDNSEYIDKVDAAKVKTQQPSPVTFTGETDRVYTPAKGPGEPIKVLEGGKPVFSVVRDSLGDVVVWNPWVEKAEGIADFAPKDGYKNMVCVEAGSVRGWQTLEPGDAFGGAQTIYAL